MKTFTTSLVFLFSFFYTYSQAYYDTDIWGTYLVQENKEMLLNLCDNNEWFFTDCQSCLTGVAHESHFSGSPIIVFGTYEYVNKNLELRNNIGELFFSFQIIDTMNIRVLYAKRCLVFGDYLNRYSSYFEGHRCSSSSSFNDYYARWAVFDLLDNESKLYYEILRFKKPGFVFENDEYEVEQLKDNIYKIK